ncbi:MAG: DUF1801 domain-containing protein [Firmicutes bacterium]|nr:DUF1801 domain-containing protein [Bacillota bacterium]
MERSNPQLDFYFEGATKWHDEVAALRRIVLKGELTETLKWGVPCYAYNGANVVLIHTFKDYCALLFIKGAILKDPQGILVQQTENVQAGRQVRFTSLRQIMTQEATLKAYVAEAVETEKAGLKVAFKKDTELKLVEEFRLSLDQNAALRKAFDALTPGRQRAYNLYFSGAKQSATRVARIEKCIPQILKGKGLDD